MMPEPFDRRRFLNHAACGFGSLALAGLCADHAEAAGSRGSAGKSGVPPLPARAKRVIFVFMQGGPSQVDTFDYKPSLEKYDGTKLKFEDARKLAKTGMTAQEAVMKSPWKFRRYGECGHAVSELFPHVGGLVDDLCFLQGMHTNGVAHGPATLFLHTGSTNFVRPAMGAWVNYGLGSENANLPGFVTVSPSAANGGPRNYANAFLPARYQGTAIGQAGQPTKTANIKFIANERTSVAEQRERFDLLQAFNRDQATRVRGADELNALIGSYELAWRMQMNAPGVLDMQQETAATQQLYGIGEKETDDFGRQCLLARRMAEAGVRYIQVNYSDNGSNPRWDQHSKIMRHADHAKAVDKPIAGLLQDLKQRGLLDDTLVWWGGEFGRNPFSQNSDGRDHNPKGFTHFLAGGGVKAGFRFGETDEFGHEAVADKVHMHDLHATILYLMGLDHEKLTYRFAGRDFRLTDVEGRIVHEIMA